MARSNAPAPPQPGLPQHVGTTVEALAELREEHLRGTSRYQRTIDTITARVGSPAFLIGITVFIGCWIAANLAIGTMHGQPFDRPPFAWLQGIVTTTALFVTVLILTTQRHENALAEHRAQLTLQIALVGERKTAKLIERSEQHRRDDPHVADSEDAEASEMAAPVDPRAMSSAIRAATGEAEKHVSPGT